MKRRAFLKALPAAIVGGLASASQGESRLDGTSITTVYEYDNDGFTLSTPKAGWAKIQFTGTMTMNDVRRLEQRGK